MSLMSSVMHSGTEGSSVLLRSRSNQHQQHQQDIASVTDLKATRLLGQSRTERACDLAASLALVVLPLIVMLGLIVYTLLLSSRSDQQASKVTDLIKQSLLVNEAVNSLQIERGLTTQMLASQGSVMDRVAGARNESNAAIVAITPWIDPNLFQSIRVGGNSYRLQNSSVLLRILSDYRHFVDAKFGLFCVHITQRMDHIQMDSAVKAHNFKSTMIAQINGDISKQNENHSVQMNYQFVQQRQENMATKEMYDVSSISKEDNVRFYTDLTMGFISVIQSTVLPPDFSSWFLMVGLNILLHYSDSLGIQRALGSSVFIECSVSVIVDNWYWNLMGNINVQQHMLNDSCPDCQRFLSKYLLLNAESVNATNRLQNKLLDNDWRINNCRMMDNQSRTTYSNYWFNNMTKKIDIINEVRYEIQQSITKDLHILISRSRQSLVGLSVTALVVCVISAVLLTSYVKTVANIGRDLTSFAAKFRLRSLELTTQKLNTERILNLMLPVNVTEQLKSGNEGVIAQYFDCVTVYFSDIVRFTDLSSKLTPFQVIDLLGALYRVFDQCIERYDVYKVETIGDAYTVVSGLPILNGISHAEEICKMSLDIRESMTKFSFKTIRKGHMKIRIGVHTGKVAAGVVGTKMPRYCLFGDTLKIAEFMESNGEAMKIQASYSTVNLLKHKELFKLTMRGDIPFEEQGSIKTYWIDKIDG